MKELISRMMNESKYKKVSAKEVDNILAGLQQEHAEDGYSVNMASYEVDSFASGTTAQVRTIKKQGIGNNWRDIKTFVGYLLIGNTYHEVPKEDWPKYAIGNMDSKMAESKVNESVTVTDRKAAENILNLLVDAQDLAGRAFKLGDEDRNSDEDIYNSISDVIGMVEYLLNIKESKKKVNEEAGQGNVEFGEDYIDVTDKDGKNVHWVIAEWTEDPDVVFSIANAVLLATQGKSLPI